MAKRVEARVSPALLVWARESIALSTAEAARKLGVKVDRLEKWESGASRPTVKQLRKAAAVYKRPFAAFYLPEPPEEPEQIRDFRRLPEGIAQAMPSGLAFEIRKAYVRRDIAIELADSLEEPVAPFAKKASLTDSIPELAGEMRALLGVSLEQQFGWKDSWDALNAWKAAIEELGVLVFQVSRIPLEVMRGFSICEEQFPVIALNPNDAPRGRIFTLFHELGHLLLQGGGLCNPRAERSLFLKRPGEESFCNRLAAEILAPAGSLLGQSILKNKDSRSEWDDYEFRRLADTYFVSPEMMVIRLRGLGRISEEVCDEQLRCMRQERLVKPKPKSQGGPSQEVRCVSGNGLAYVRLVLSAYHKATITASDVSDYLGIRLKHLPKVEDRMALSLGSRGLHT